MVLEKENRFPGIEISNITPEEFLEGKNFFPPEAVSSSNERRIKVAEKKRILNEKIDEFKAWLENFEDVLLAKDKELLLSQVRFIEQALKTDKLTLDWLDNSIEFMDKVLEQLKGQI